MKNPKSIFNIIIPTFALATGYYLYNIFTLGESYHTTGKVISTPSKVGGGKGARIGPAVLVKLENGQSALVQSYTLSIGTIIDLQCFKTEGSKTQTCNLIK